MLAALGGSCGSRDSLRCWLLGGYEGTEVRYGSALGAKKSRPDGHGPLVITSSCMPCICSIYIEPCFYDCYHRSRITPTGHDECHKAVCLTDQNTNRCANSVASRPTTLTTYPQAHQPGSTPSATPAALASPNPVMLRLQQQRPPRPSSSISSRHNRPQRTLLPPHPPRAR